MTEHFPHDVCPKCGIASVPLEKVPDQTGRGCPNCGFEWFEDTSTPPITTPKNTNCLAGIQCPKCGSLEPFYIDVTAWMLVTDDGTDTARDVDWGNDSGIQCVACKHRGKVKNFTAE